MAAQAPSAPPGLSVLAQIRVPERPVGWWGAAGQTGGNGLPGKGYGTPGSTGQRWAGGAGPSLCRLREVPMCPGVRCVASSQPLPRRECPTRSCLGLSWVKPLSAVTGAGESSVAQWLLQGAAGPGTPSSALSLVGLRDFSARGVGTLGAFAKSFSCREAAGRGAACRPCSEPCLLLPPASALLPDGLPKGGTVSAEMSRLFSEGRHAARWPCGEEQGLGRRVLGRAPFCLLHSRVLRWVSWAAPCTARDGPSTPVLLSSLL